MTNTTNTTNNTATTPEFIATPTQKKNIVATLKEKAAAMISDIKTEGPVKAAKKNLRSLIAILLAVTVVISIGSLLGGLGYKRAVKKSIECYLGDNVLYVTNTIPNCVWKEYADYMDEGVLKLKIGAIGEAIENKANRNEFENVTYELDDFDELRHSEVRDMKDMITDHYESIDENDIGDKMYETTVTLEYEYDGEEIEEEADIVAVKINGRWYAVNPYGGFLSFVF